MLFWFTKGCERPAYSQDKTVAYDYCTVFRITNSEFRVVTFLILFFAILIAVW